MRSIRNWSRPEKVALGMWMLAGSLLLTIAAQQEPTRETKAAHSPRMVSTQPSPIQQHSLPAATSLDRTLSAPILWAHVKPVGVALSDDSGKRKCSKQGAWWIAPGDEGLFWTKKQCENYRQRKELEKSKPYWIPSLTNNELYPEPTFHPNPNDYWM